MWRRSLWAAVSTLFATVGSVPASEYTQQCVEDTWGMAGSSYSKPYVHVDQKKELHCTFTEVDVSQLQLFAVNWYNSSEEFDRDWSGVDMNPKRHAEYASSPYEAFRQGNLRPWNGSNGPPFQKSDIKLSSCGVQHSDGSAFRIQRVGPLVSTGGYDYWQFGWRDLWGLSNVLSQHPEGVMITTSFSAGVLADGTALGFPPIHIHHIHIGPRGKDITGQSNSGVGVKVKEGSDAVLGLEQHGDYECKKVDGGTDCFFERVGDGFAKVVDTPLALEGELNDVRAFHSEPMTWWYQIVVRYMPLQRTLRPLSQTFIVGPGPLSPSQLATLMVFPTPTGEDTFYWYTGQMEHDGALVRNKIHSHNSQFHKAFWFHATPQELGLSESRFQLGTAQYGCGNVGPLDTCIPRPLRHTGFTTFEDFSAYLLQKLATAAAAHDARCSFLATSQRCHAQRPALICQANSSFAEVRDPRSGKFFRYDRRAPSCCRPWNFRKGDTFTVVGFMRKAERPPGPWNPDIIPETLPMHLHWVMQWDARDNTSHYLMWSARGDRSELQTSHMRDDPNATVQFLDRGGWNKRVIYSSRLMLPMLRQEQTEEGLSFMDVGHSVVRGLHRGRPDSSGRVEATMRLAGASASMAMLWFVCGRRWRKDCPTAVHCVRLWLPRFPSLKVKYVQHSV